MSLLIENKLDAMQQPDQEISYQEEATYLSSKGVTASTMLVAPKAYISAHEAFARGFSQVVSYEAIVSAFRSRAETITGELSHRLTFRADLLDQAINKGRRGYMPVIHPAKLAFNGRYNELLLKLAPDLIPGPSMLKEGPAQSKTMIFDRETLPTWDFLPKMRIVHQLRGCNANLNFFTWGNSWEKLERAVLSGLEETVYSAQIANSGRKSGAVSLKIVAETPYVDHLGNFDSQVDEISRGIETTARLKAWFLSNMDTVAHWAEIEAASAPERVG